MIYFNAEAISYPFRFRLIFETEFVAILVNFDTCKKNSTSGPESLERYKPNQDASLPVTFILITLRCRKSTQVYLIELRS